MSHLNGLTAEARRRANVMFCAHLNKRDPANKYHYQQDSFDIQRVGGHTIYVVRPPTDSHDSLQRVLDVMTHPELHTMRNHLFHLFEQTNTGYSFPEWLIKHDHAAFVTAALVAIGAGEGE